MNIFFKIGLTAVALSLIAQSFTSCDLLTKEDSSQVLKEVVLKNPKNRELRSPTNLTFYWNSAAVDSGVKVYYDVYFGEGSESNMVLFQKNNEDTFLELVTDLKNSTKYYWKVIAKVFSSGIENSSSVYSFRTIDSPIRVTGIQLNKNVINLQLGNREFVTAMITPKSAKNQGISWQSSDSRIAIISDIQTTGESAKDNDKDNDKEQSYALKSKVSILAVGEGVAVVTATTKDGNFTKELTISVFTKLKSVLGVSINANDFEVPIGKSVQLLTSIIPRDADNTRVTWSLNPPKGRARITSDGVLIGETEGQVQVIVITDDNNFSDEIKVSFTTPVIPAVDLTVDKNHVSVLVAGKQKVIATVSPENATYQKVIWESGDDFLVGVQNGIITGRRVTEENTFVTARLEDYSKIKTITVKVISNPILVQDIGFKRNKIIMVVNRVSKIDYKITPADATNKELTWSTSNPSIAAVNELGIINALGIGSVSVTARSTSGVTRAFNIDVVAKDPSRSEIDDLPENKKYRFVFNNKLYYIVNKNMTWNSAAGFSRRLSGTDSYIHLVHIDNKEEQEGIVKALKYATSGNNPNKITFDVSGEGNGSTGIYVWTGATDREKENTWIWNGDGDYASDFDSKLGTGRGSYSGNTETWRTVVQGNNFWGKAPNGKQLEPNSGAGKSGTTQEDYMGISLETWLNGSQYQWNDLSGAHKYPFILEIE